MFLRRVQWMICAWYLEQFPRMIETNLAKSRNGAVKTMVKFTGNQEVNQ